MIVLNSDESVWHSGVASTLTYIRSKFLIVKRRETVKMVLKKCWKYVNGKILLGPATPCLSDIRINCNHSLEFVGVDFVGPIYYKVKNSVYKACLLLFTYGLIRASNIELTSDQSLLSVILALRSFLAKRGKVKLVINDNFQTFKSTELNNLYGSLLWKSRPGGEGSTKEW